MPEASTSTVEINAKNVNVKSRGGPKKNHRRPEVRESGTQTKPSRRNRGGKRKGAGKHIAPADGTMAPTILDPKKVKEDPVVATILSSKLPDSAKDWAHAYLDPCSNWLQVPSHTRIPDGAMPNSSPMDLRGGFNCFPPSVETQVNPQQQVTLDGRMWSLTIIQVPLFRHPFILIANMGAGEMSEEDQDLLAAKWNNTRDPPIYPVWETLNAATSAYWSAVHWTALADVKLPDPHSGLPSEIKAYRTTAAGINAIFNTPDLVNQGVAVTGQWSFDHGTADAVTEKVVQINHHSGRWMVIRASTTWNYSLDIRIPAVVVDAITSNSLRAYMVRRDYDNFSRNPPTSSNGYCFPRFFFNDGSAGNQFLHTFVTAEILSFTDSDEVAWTIPSGTEITTTYVVGSASAGVSPGVTVTMTCTITVDDTEVALTVFQGAVTPGAIIRTNMVRPSVDVIDDNVEAMTEMVSTFGLPPVNAQQMIQSTPKTTTFLLKSTSGAYMPLRMFEPQFLVQNAATARPICMGRPGVLPTSGGPIDTIDLNFGCGTMLLSGMSYAAAPFLKLTRDFEVIASDTTLLQLTMTPGEEPCKRILDFVRAVSDHHPFAYPSTYNCFGTLAKSIFGMIEALPIDKIAGPIINNVVKAVTEDKSTHNNASKLKRVVSRVTAGLR